MQRMPLLWNLLQFSCKGCYKYDITVTLNPIFKYQVLWFSVTFMLCFVPKTHFPKFVHVRRTANNFIQNFFLYAFHQMIVKILVIIVYVYLFAAVKNELSTFIIYFTKG